MRAANTASISATSSVCFPPESSTGVRPLPVFEARAFRAQAVRTFGGVVAVSEAMHQVFNLVEPFARTDVSVTLLGETGTGKDVLAHSLHEQSSRTAGPFVVFDCGAVAPNLAESELLGHERGSFTGAVASHAGAFERADGGTLFLERDWRSPGRAATSPSACTRRRTHPTGRRYPGTPLQCTESRRRRTAICAPTLPPVGSAKISTIVLPPRWSSSRHFAIDSTTLISCCTDCCAILVTLASRLTSRPSRPVRTRDWPGNVRELKNTLACALAFLEEGGERIEPQHLLRGIKHPFTTPNVSPHIDDATDVMLGNTSRRHTGRTDLVPAHRGR